MVAKGGAKNKSDKERRRVERRRNERRSEGKIAAARRPADQRRHTRYDKVIPVRIFKRGHKKNDPVAFQASVASTDISFGGVFLESTFFLKQGFEMELELDLTELDRTIRVDGVVAYVVDENSAKKAKRASGFAIQFTRWHGDSEVYLRSFLTKGDMFEFVEQHAKQILPGVKKKDLPRLVELIVRWQIYQEGLNH